MTPHRSLLALPVGLLPATVMAEAIHTAKSPTCGCCRAWIEHMAMKGHEMNVDETDDAALPTLKVALGIAESMMSCQTARSDSYVIEGHVPAADVGRLLAERPDAIGLRVPGMVNAIPGMGPGGAAMRSMPCR